MRFESFIFNILFNSTPNFIHSCPPLNMDLKFSSGIFERLSNSSLEWLLCSHACKLVYSCEVISGQPYTWLPWCDIEFKFYSGMTHCISKLYLVFSRCYIIVSLCQTKLNLINNN